MELRPLESSDLEDAPPWVADRTLRPDLWRDEHTRSVAARDEFGELVAVGIIWTSRVHGDRYWIDVAVHPDRRRRSIGTGVVRHLRGLRASPLAFMSRGFVDDPALAFADALGARTIQVVPPIEVSTSARLRLRADAATVAGSALSPDAIERANAAIYEWTHAAWSPVGPNFAVALNEDLWDELDLEATSVVTDEAGEVLAMSLVYCDSDPLIITSETVDPHEPEGERLVEVCVRRSLDVLAGRGQSRVEFDGHVTDPHFMPVLARLAPAGRWFRLVEMPA